MNFLTYNCLLILATQTSTFELDAPIVGCPPRPEVASRIASAIPAILRFKSSRDSSIHSQVANFVDWSNVKQAELPLIAC